MRTYTITITVESRATKAEILEDFQKRVGQPYRLGSHIGVVDSVTVAHVAKGKK
mgnify:CR=1 FL=1